MPVLIYVSSLEAEALRAANVKDADGMTLTYNPRQSANILAMLPKGEARDSLSERFAAVATQLGIPDVMFKKVRPVIEAPGQTDFYVSDEAVEQVLKDHPLEELEETEDASAEVS